MRIAYLVNQYPKISHSFIRREIAALERLGFEITRVALRGWADELADQADVDERQRTNYVLSKGPLRLLFIAFRTMVQRPLAFLAALCLTIQMSRRAERPFPIHLIYLVEACFIADQLRKARIPHLHAHFGTNSAEVAMLAHELGGPTWSFTVHGPEEFDKAAALGLSEKLRRCKFVVAISSYTRSQLYRWVAHDHWNKIHVVHCGLEASYFEHSTAPAPTENRLVCIGRLSEQKGQLVLLDALHLLNSAGEKIELIFAGDGEMRPAIENLIRHHRLENCVKITGWISGEEVQSQIVNARALVLPSLAEGLPVVLMEAMALRRPVISTFIAGIPELVQPEKNGWLVPAGDAPSLALAIRDCLNVPADAMRKIGSNAHERCRERHCIDDQAKLLAHVFKTNVSTFNGDSLPS